LDLCSPGGSAETDWFSTRIAAGCRDGYTDYPELSAWKPVGDHKSIQTQHSAFAPRSEDDKRCD
jgi:hypothetical protein